MTIWLEDRPLRDKERSRTHHSWAGVSLVLADRDKRGLRSPENQRLLMWHLEVAFHLSDCQIPRSQMLPQGKQAFSL